MSKRGRERGGEEDADNVSQTQTEKLQRNRGEERARAAAAGLKVKLRRCRAAEGASRELGDEKHCPFVATDNTFHSSCLYVGVCSVRVCVCVCVCRPCASC